MIYPLDKITLSHVTTYPKADVKLTDKLIIDGESHNILSVKFSDLWKGNKSSVTVQLDDRYSIKAIGYLILNISGTTKLSPNNMELEFNGKFEIIKVNFNSSRLLIESTGDKHLSGTENRELRLIIQALLP